MASRTAPPYRADHVGSLLRPRELIEARAARQCGESGADALRVAEDKAIDVSKVDVSLNGIELQDREFVAAIRDRREPNASVAQVLPCYRILHELDQQLQEQT